MPTRPQPSTDDSPPASGSWRSAYLWLIVVLVLQILLYSLLTIVYN